MHTQPAEGTAQVLTPRVGLEGTGCGGQRCLMHVHPCLGGAGRWAAASKLPGGPALQLLCPHLLPWGLFQVQLDALALALGKLTRQRTVEEL